MSTDQDLNKRVVSKFVESMATVFPRLTGTTSWGFYSREDPRMHLQTVDQERKKDNSIIRVWLENLGTRTFEIDVCPDDKDSRKAVDALKKKLLTDRKKVEVIWTNLMYDKDWIKTELRGDVVVVTAYPGYHSKFTRLINLREEGPGLYRNNPDLKIDPKDVTLKKESMSLSVKAADHEFVDIPLEEILWQGSLSV